jgi:hypothetical protein
VVLIYGRPSSPFPRSIKVSHNLHTVCICILTKTHRNVVKTSNPNESSRRHTPRPVGKLATDIIELRDMNRNEQDMQPLDMTRDHEGGETQGLLEAAGTAHIQEETLRSPGLFVWTLTVAAALSGLLFGYEYVFGPNVYLLRIGVNLLI